MPVDVAVTVFAFETMDDARRAFRNVNARCGEHEKVVSAYTALWNGDPVIVVGGPKFEAVNTVGDWVVEQGGKPMRDFDPMDLLPFAKRIAAAHQLGVHGTVDHTEDGSDGLRL